MFFTNIPNKETIVQSANEILRNIGIGNQLHVYSNDVEYVIAESVEEAQRIVEQVTGAHLDGECFGQEDDDAMLGVWCKDGEPDEINGPDCMLVEKTFREWTERGKGFLCCTEQ